MWFLCLGNEGAALVTVKNVCPRVTCSHRQIRWDVVMPVNVPQLKGAEHNLCCYLTRSGAPPPLPQGANIPQFTPQKHSSPTFTAFACNVVWLNKSFSASGQKLHVELHFLKFPALMQQHSIGSTRCCVYLLFQVGCSFINHGGSTLSSWRCWVLYSVLSFQPSQIHVVYMQL